VPALLAPLRLSMVVNEGAPLACQVEGLEEAAANAVLTALVYDQSVKCMELANDEAQEQALPCVHDIDHDMHKHVEDAFSALAVIKRADDSEGKRLQQLAIACCRTASTRMVFLVKASSNSDLDAKRGLLGCVESVHVLDLGGAWMVTTPGDLLNASCSGSVAVLVAATYAQARRTMVFPTVSVSAPL
tara:strand:- start:80 stop:643 length:564 start_codon:yes stop_codon:yes gene_type:complete